MNSTRTYFLCTWISIGRKRDRGREEEIGRGKDRYEDWRLGKGRKGRNRSEQHKT